jgi:hypothetical protein
MIKCNANSGLNNDHQPPNQPTLVYYTYKLDEITVSRTVVHQLLFSGTRA